MFEKIVFKNDSLFSSATIPKKQQQGKHEKKAKV